ncbi:MULTISPECIES: sigma factor [unclassified Leucobacter]|uniref:sigma factor n=1 Tax=unclassified Leucobacter TaxID=2621730 RepID=UPI00203D1DC0|nr:MULTISPECIES: sigma factor [unclassified Leucobacter]
MTVKNISASASVSFAAERAIQKWDFRKGFKLSTYATWWVQQAITRATADTSRTIRIPVHNVEELKKAQSLKKDAEAHADESTALALVANQLQMTVRDLTALLKLDEPPLNIDRRVWSLSRVTSRKSHSVTPPSTIMTKE